MFNLLSLLLQAVLYLYVTDCLNTYRTPAADSQFSKFVITDNIPSDGRGGSGAMQEALTTKFDKYHRRYIAFNFKGKGNAQLLFQNAGKSKSFRVVIGGGTGYNKIHIYDHKGKHYVTTIGGVTSEMEFRTYWIRWKWKNGADKYKVFVGLCSDPRHNGLLQSEDRGDWKVKIRHILISTSQSNSGRWQFASDGEKQGGCGDSISCQDTSLKCDQKDIDWDHDRTGLLGTCVFRLDNFSSRSFGSGVCRKPCGTSSTICDVDETCVSNTCISKTTTSTTAATTTTTTAAPTSTAVITTTSASTTTSTLAATTTTTTAASTTTAITTSATTSRSTITPTTAATSTTIASTTTPITTDTTTTITSTITPTTTDTTTTTTSTSVTTEEDCEADMTTDAEECGSGLTTEPTSVTNPNTDENVTTTCDLMNRMSFTIELWEACGRGSHAHISTILYLTPFVVISIAFD